MFAKIQKQIEDFFAATKKPYSYNIIANIYIWFGILWGLPIPLVTLFYEVHYLSSAGIDNPVTLALSSPYQWFFIAHPIIFGVIFGVLGTLHHEKDVELKNKIEELDSMTQHDPLTGLKNRRYFSEIFQDEFARSYRRQESLSLLFLDIDNFKQINDNYGHFIGDKVLREIGAYLLKHCRPYDTPVRWGGEEFIVLLRATNEATAIMFAERIRTGVEIGFSSDISLNITISIGLTEHKENDTLETMTDRADQALYHAKQSGKNRVISWSEYQAYERIREQGGEVRFTPLKED